MGSTASLLDVEDSIDIELQSNAIGRYRGQGVYWRGHGTGGLPDATNMTRVAGPVTLENFLLHGASWLVKFERQVAILLPGGLAFLTLVAELSWYERFYPHGRTPEAIAEYLEKGFVDHGWQQDVGVDNDCPGAYVQVSHGQGYVRSTWSELFEIVDWIDGFADLQSFVIVRK